MNSTDRRLLTLQEGAAICGVGLTKFRAELDSGRCESVHIGRARRVPIQALDEYIKRLREEAQREGSDRTD